MSVLKVGVGWCTGFQRPGLKGLLYRRLRHAYRAPSFFAGLMLAAGHSVSFIHFDESLELADLDGTHQRLSDDVDLLYLATHGESPKGGYRLALHSTDWIPCASQFGLRGPSVAVFDTCDLVDLRDPQWQATWVSSIGPSLRLLLGFASPATVAETSTKRGREFGERILAGSPIGPSWLAAVHSTGYVGTDVGIAIGIGDHQRDAQWALDSMSLGDLPAARTQSNPVLELEACH